MGDIRHSIACDLTFQPDSKATFDMSFVVIGVVYLSSSMRYDGEMTMALNSRTAKPCPVLLGTVSF